MTVAYWPTFQKQLVDSVPTRGEDCVVRSGLMGLDYATRGALRPTVRDFRKRAGRTAGGLNTAELERAVLSYDTPAETHGYSDLVCDRVLFGDWQADVQEALGNGHWVCLWINYGWLNDHYPSLSGDRVFRSTHCIGLLGFRRKSGRFLTRAYDPTWDGRRPGIPKGPRWVPMGVYRQAAAAVNGVVECRGGIILPARKL